MGAVLNGTASNPLTLSKLAETIGFQVGLLGGGLLLFALLIVPYLFRMEDRAMSYPKGVRRFYRLLPSFTFKGVCFILLVGTLGILLTDVGWPKAIQTYQLPTALLFARASGAPNGAHLLSYIPLPLLGIYVAWKYRTDILLDCFQGILVVAFGVAIHESIWLVIYWIEYAQYWNLAVATNITEDFFFFAMCMMFVYAFWKYPFRKVPMKAFLLVVAPYSVFMSWWLSEGVPVTTINNWQLGQGIFMTTHWWADPFVNGIEILSWVFVAAFMFLAVKFYG